MKDKPILWVPTLYLAEGIPYTAIITTSVIFLKIRELGVADIAIYTSWLYLPWLIKPLWSPLVEMAGKSRLTISACQILMGGAFASIALTMPAESWLAYCIAALWLAAFMSATHDIAADGFYIDALDTRQQSAWVGIRSTFYKIAMLISQGGIVVLAGMLTGKYGAILAWQAAFMALAVLMAAFGIYHLAALPKPAGQDSARKQVPIMEQLRTYFCKDNMATILLFLLTFRLGESQLGKISPLFMLDSEKSGGLALDPGDLGVINGTFGLIAMSLGGIAGGVLIARQGLRKWIIPMALALNVPDALYLIMSHWHIQSFAAITLMVSAEQLGYGFGFAAYSVFMLQISKGQHSTSHYSISTAFMAMGMMLPGLISGPMQERLGYTGFFAWVLACCLPSLAMAIVAKRKILKQ